MKIHIKKLLAGIISATMLLSSLSVFAVNDSSIIDSGKCGDNLTWTLDNDGTLTISGTGDMNTKDALGDITGAPWGKYSDSLKTLVIESGVTSISTGAFKGCSGFIGSLVIPDSVLSIGIEAFKNCTGFTGDLIIPDSVTSVNTSAFKNCSGFDGTLQLSDNMTLISAYAFENCRNLHGDLILPDGLSEINYCTFKGCSRLNGNLVIPDSVTLIGGNAFSECSFSGNLILPDNVTSIGNYAFSTCRGFTGNLVIPDSVTSIGSMSFYGCEGIRDMYIPQAEDSISSGSFPNRVHWKYDLSKCAAEIADYTCTGSAIIPTEDSITVTSPKGKTLYYGTDYVIDTDSASHNINVGTATVRIVPPEGGISVSSQSVPFNIVGIDLSNATVIFPDNITWNGAAVEPEPTVVMDSKTLTKGVDYTVTYSNNIFTAADFPTKDTVKTATATISGIGNYIGSLTKDFEVGGFDPNKHGNVYIDDERLVTVAIDSTFVYNGSEHKPIPKLVYHYINPTTNVAIDYDLVEGKDFKIVSYENNINAGEAIITVEGIGTFENTLDITFDISPCELSATTIADIPSYEYCKKDICPDVEIKVGDTVMTNGADYELTYENNRNRGTATVTITGKGNLTGVTTKTFEITPRDGSKFVYIIWI